MIIVITGPTCMGKSMTAYFLAKHIGAEIINGDAFQCYKEMDIGVAKPEEKYTKEITHHLYSFIDVDHDYSIAEYQSNLRSKIDELIKQNKNIIIVGGSGLYIRSALYDYAFNNNKPVDMSKYIAMDNRTLHDELKKIDPVDAEKIHMNNRKRILRAIEIYLSSGENKTAIINKQQHKLVYDAKFFVKNTPRELLYERINARVDEMMQKGLLKEAESLYKKYGDSPHALQAIGYKELITYLKGETTLEEAVELIKKNTRNYAKRQLTFIRHQFPVTYYKNNADLLEIIKK